MGMILWDIVVMSTLTLAFMFAFSVFSRRVLQIHIGIVRLTLAGIAGLLAQVGFESQFVWGDTEYTPAFLPLQLGILFFVAIAFLVLAELFVPAGSVPRPDQIVTAIKNQRQRNRRYIQILNIAVRNKLVPFKLSLGPSLTERAERQKQAKSLRVALEEAGGAFIKLGQMLSTRTDLIPQEFLSELSSLQQKVPPAPWSEMLTQLETNLKAPIETIFSSIEQTPLAAASIGQVHRASLLDGTPVAVKIQRPGIVPLVDRDIDITLRMARKIEQGTTWGRDLGALELAQGFANNLREELDYRIEASNMSALNMALQSRPEIQRIRIPKYFPEYSTEKILVMELVQGNTLSDTQTLNGFGEIQRREWAKMLLESLLHQIIDDGVFHADMHPGNIIVTPSNELVLLDFGAVGRLDARLRSHVGDLLFALYRGDSLSFTDALIQISDIPEDINLTSLQRQVGSFLAVKLAPGARIDTTVFTELIQLLKMNRVSVPAELAGAFRAIACVEGTLRILSKDFDFLSTATDYARDKLKESTTAEAGLKLLRDEVQQALPILRRMPRQIDQLTQDLGAGRLSISVRPFADRRDRSLIRELMNLAAVTFLAGTNGIMAAMLLTSNGGIEITETLSLFQLFGFLLVIISGILTLKVLFDVFRLRQRD